MVSKKRLGGKKTSSIVVASKGGVARAESLSREERSAIAKRAAEERWAKVSGLPKETHSGILKLGAGIPVSVLDNGKRVFSARGMLRAFGAAENPKRATLESGAPVPQFLSAKNIRPFISDELRHKLESPNEYRPMIGGRTALGYDADILTFICDALLDARSAGVLGPNQVRIAAGAEALMRAFSKVGVVALIDEATGYQADRASEELQKLVAAYVVEDMRPWVSLFPDSFFRQVYRIHGWNYQPGVTQGPRYVGKFINRYVYDRLPPGALEKLRRLNPVVGKRRKHKHHQFLSDDIGEPAVDRHLASVTTLMTVSTNKQHFDDMFRVAFPKPGEQLLLGPIVHPQASPHDTESSYSLSLGDGNAESVNGIAIVGVAASVREKVMSFLRSRSGASFWELAAVAYGADNETRGTARDNVKNKLSRLLNRMAAEGVVEALDADVWRARTA